MFKPLHRLAQRALMIRFFDRRPDAPHRGQPGARDRQALGQTLLHIAQGPQPQGQARRGHHLVQLPQTQPAVERGEDGDGHDQEHVVSENARQPQRQFLVHPRQSVPVILPGGLVQGQRGVARRGKLRLPRHGRTGAVGLGHRLQQQVDDAGMQILLHHELRHTGGQAEIGGRQVRRQIVCPGGHHHGMHGREMMRDRGGLAEIHRGQIVAPHQLADQGMVRAQHDEDDIGQPRVQPRELIGQGLEGEGAVVLRHAERAQDGQRRVSRGAGPRRKRHPRAAQRRHAGQHAQGTAVEGEQRLVFDAAQGGDVRHPARIGLVDDEASIAGGIGLIDIVQDGEGRVARPQPDADAARFQIIAVFLRGLIPRSADWPGLDRHHLGGQRHDESHQGDQRQDDRQHPAVAGGQQQHIQQRPGPRGFRRRLAAGGAIPPEQNPAQRQGGDARQHHHAGEEQDHDDHEADAPARRRQAVGLTQGGGDGFAHADRGADGGRHDQHDEGPQHVGHEQQRAFHGFPVEMPQRVEQIVGHIRRGVDRQRQHQDRRRGNGETQTQDCHVRGQDIEQEEHHHEGRRRAQQPGQRRRDAPQKTEAVPQPGQGRAGHGADDQRRRRDPQIGQEALQERDDETARDAVHATAPRRVSQRLIPPASPITSMTTAR